MQELQLLNLTLGMSLFVVYNDTIIYNKGFGVKDMETKIAPDLDTIYDIGSVTKMFTSALFFVRHFFFFFFFLPFPFPFLFLIPFLPLPPK